MKTIVKHDKNTLYSFQFLPEGFNSVWADSTEQAISEAKRLFPSLASKVDPTSFKSLRTQVEQDAYWDSLPLMD